MKKWKKNIKIKKKIIKSDMKIKIVLFFKF